MLRGSIPFVPPHVVDASALSIGIVLHAFVVVIYMWLLYVILGTRVSPSIFGLMFMGSVMSIFSFKLCAVFCWGRCEESACCFVWVENEVVCPCMYFM